MEGDSAALVLSPSFSRRSLPRVPPRAHRAPRTVIQRYQQIAKSQRQTAGKCAKRDELPARRAIRYKLESDRVSYFFLVILLELGKIKKLDLKSYYYGTREIRVKLAKTSTIQSLEILAARGRRSGPSKAVACKMPDVRVAANCPVFFYPLKHL